MATVVESWVRFPDSCRPPNRPSGVVEDITIKNKSPLVTHVEICFATPVVVVPSVVDLAVTRSRATKIGQAKGAIWLVLARIVLSDPSETSLVSHAVLLPFLTTYIAGKDAASGQARKTTRSPMG